MKPLLLAVALLGPVTVPAQTFQAYGQVNAIVTQVAPTPGEVLEAHPSFSWLNDPRAVQATVLDPLPLRVSIGGRAEGRFEGRIGTLKAYAAAFYPGCCTADGRRVVDGYAWVEARGGFYDEVLVQGAGLALGSPVRYEVEFRIDGRLSSPASEAGGYLAAAGLASLSFRDLSSGQQLRFDWDATRQATGSYRFVLDTAVGNRLAIASTLYASASVDARATSARGAVADFGHSAYFYLAPSVDGLNTLGASGHDFMAPVPEPSSWLLMAGGLLGLIRGRLSSWRRAA
jgi:PEP-CTERM motif